MLNILGNGKPTFIATASLNADALQQLAGLLDDTTLHVDPYLAWALLKTRLSDAAREVPLLVEFDRSVDDFSQVLPGFALYPTFVSPRHALAPSLKVQPVVTTLAGLSALLTKGTVTPVRSIEISRVQDTESSIEKVRESNIGPFAAVAGRAVAKVPENYGQWLEFGREWAKPTREDPVKPSDGPQSKQLLGPLVCVVDDRCNFASPAAAIVQLWHQGGDPDTLGRLSDKRGWRPALTVKPTFAGNGMPLSFDFGGAFYGRRLTPQPPGNREDEAQTYRSAGYIDSVLRWSHGSAVLDLVAGPQVWGRDGHGRGAWRPRQHRPLDVRFVQLPVPTVTDTSGGSLSCHALDAIRFAVDEAEPGRQVIVNLSYGTHSGGHDGGSLWDKGLCELLDTYDGCSPASLRKKLHVVLPAGNSHLLRSHAAKRLCASNDALTLLLKIQPDNPDESYLEIWLPDGMDAHIAVTPPGSGAGRRYGKNESTLEVWSRPDPGQPRQFRPYAALVLPRPVPQGRQGAMALLAVAPTIKAIEAPEAADAPLFDWRSQPKANWIGNDPSTNSAHGTLRTVPAPHGVWTVKIKLRSGEGAVHAWVQRGDAAPGRGQQSRGHRGRQSYLLDTDDDPQGTPVDPAFTLNGIATLKHDRLHVIGAMRHSDYGVSPYSGAGPNRGCERRFEGPDRVVVADESLNQPGLLLKGLLSGSRLRLSGTSMAAAAYTRLLWEHLAQCPSSDGSDLLSCITAGATPPEFVSRGSPTRAPLMHRGDESIKLVAEHANGTISPPAGPTCTPFAGPPPGRPPSQR